MLIRTSLVCLALISLSGCGSARLASNQVTAGNIRKVALGMSQTDVIAILGEPLAIERKPEQWYGPDAIQMDYSSPAPGARWYPMLWVHLSKGQVIEVYAKRYVYWGLDHEGVYGLSKELPPPTMDRLESTFPK